MKSFLRDLESKFYTCYICFVKETPRNRNKALLRNECLFFLSVSLARFEAKLVRFFQKYDFRYGVNLFDDAKKSK